MPNYGDPKYWEDRYKNQNGKTFDWWEDYDTLKSIVTELNLDKNTAQVLNIGCGNAEMSEDMYRDGFKNIHNIDISDTVIEQMKERNKNNNMKCKH